MKCVLICLILCLGCTSSGDLPSSGQSKTSTAQPVVKTKNAPSEAYEQIIHRETAYYLTGPQQGRPPEGRFGAGTRCTIVQSNGNYTLIKTAKGVVAWIQTDALNKVP